MAPRFREQIATVGLALALLVALFLAYQPAWNGGFVWDDEYYVLKPELHSWQGLAQIWTDIWATQQYFPLLHSVFWLEHRLWGEHTLGYHLVSIALHGLAALLFWRLLRRLEVPGACLAAAIFALHPVHVESVAWIAELKNTLSGVFYLGAALAYLPFDRTRATRWYDLSLALFVAAVLSKTTTATLPAALLVILWWKRGRLTWKADVLPLVPFFLVGAGEGLFTAWVECHVAGAQGPEFAWGAIQRCLIACHAFWFYLGKLFWPVNLIIIYPRWQINAHEWWQYLFPFAAAGLFAALWAFRHCTRAPLAVMLLFVGTLFPVLGFLNIGIFLHSFVADHFLYLPSLGVIALVVAGLGWCIDRPPRWIRVAGSSLCLVLVLALAALTWQQAHMYRDAETLYRTTIARNPESWTAPFNLAGTLVDLGRPAEAIDYYRQTLRVKPDHAEAHSNWGNTLFAQGRVAEALEHYQEAVRIKPGSATIHYNYANALLDLERPAEAIEHFETTVRLDPTSADAHNNWGNALTTLGRPADAIEHFKSAIRLRPSFPQAHYNYANSLIALGRPADAIEQYRLAVQLNPDYAEAHYNWGKVLMDSGRTAEAIEHGRQAARLMPHNAAVNRLVAWLLATHETSDGGDPVQSVQLAQRACALVGHKDVACLDTLAAAYASARRFDEAIATAKEAWQSAQAAGQKSQAEEIHMRIQLYRDQKPYCTSRGKPRTGPR
jgi:tetratricopeptide (TPR) repeat protein